MPGRHTVEGPEKGGDSGTRCQAAILLKKGQGRVVTVGSGARLPGWCRAVPVVPGKGCGFIISSKQPRKQSNLLPMASNQVLPRDANHLSALGELGVIGV